MPRTASRGEGVAHARGVRTKQVQLDLSDLFGGDTVSREGSEAGIDPVYGVWSASQVLDRVTGGLDPLDRLVIQCHLEAVLGDGVDIRDGQRPAIERQRFFTWAGHGQENSGTTCFAASRRLQCADEGPRETG